MTKITSLNLYGLNHWQQRKTAIVDYIKKEDPDIILFQEVVYLPEESPYTQTTLLNRHLEYPYEQTVVSRLQESPHYAAYREGLSVLSKYPITKSETLVLKQDPKDHLQRIVQLFDINYHGYTVKLSNVHFAELPEMAVDHLRELLGILDSRHERRIIAGDFNMPHLEDYSDLWNHGYTASISEPYISYPGENKRIDYFLMPKSNLFVDLLPSPDTLSDHRAITANILLKV
ncbi:MAG: hypothetical protein JWN33_162 [Candidatus Saccharibacteria bacterium]|nr:hypothetical protein [Candidatus Saccharibacteria bacterium]